jgi:hypothetical protein
MLRALEQLIVRNDSLRTSLVADRPIAKLLRAEAVRVELIDLHREPSPEDQALHRGVEQWQRPYAFGEPIFRPVLYRVGEHRHLLVLACHHIIFEPVTGALWLEELRALYASLVKGTAPPATPVMQYSDYARWQRGWLAGDQIEQALARWRRRLRDVAPVPLAGDRPRNAWGPVAMGGAQIPTHVAVAVRSLCERTAHPPSVVLAAALLRLARRYSSHDAVFRMAASSRRGDTLKLVGPVGNLVPITARLSDDPDAERLLYRVHRCVDQAWNDIDLPLSRTVPNESWFFNFLPYVRATTDRSFADGVTIEPIQLPLPPEEQLFTLQWKIFEQESSFAISLAYRSDILSASAANDMIREYQTLVEEMVSPSRDLSAGVRR